MATKIQRATVEEQPIVEKPVVKKRNDYILCHSIIAGGLNVTCKSGNCYEFKRYGSDCEIEYHDLCALVRKHSDHVFLPRFVIDDEDFLDEFPQVKKVYDSMYTDGDLKDVLSLEPEQMKQVIASLPTSTYSTLKSLAATGIADGVIDSVKKIRTLTEIFGSDFALLSEIFGN